MDLVMTMPPGRRILSGTELQAGIHLASLALVPTRPILLVQGGRRELLIRSLFSAAAAAMRVWKMLFCILRVTCARAPSLSNPREIEIHCCRLFVAAED